MSWLVLTGINYQSTKAKREVRAEPGEVVSDIPNVASAWFESVGAIRPAQVAGSPGKDNKGGPA